MNLRQKVEAALLRQAAKEAGRIRAALKYSVNAKEVVADFLNQNFTTITPADARAWTRVHVHPKNQDNLRAAVRNAIATGYAMGEQSAQGHFAQRSYLKKAAPTKRDINAWLNTDIWDNWKPGHQPAALLLKPKGGLHTLLDRAGATISGLNRTTIDRIGTKLSDGLARGATSDEIADDIDAILDDPQRSLTIANTEMARAMSTASMDTYEGFGVEQVEWLHSDYCNCNLCNDAEDLGPQPVGYDWSQGEIDGGVTEPPMHPNCICAIAPVIDEGDPQDLVDVADSIEMAATATLVKDWNEEDHPRDESGRFESGGGSDKPYPNSENHGTESQNKYLDRYIGTSYRPLNQFLRGQEGYDAMVGFNGDRTVDEVLTEMASEINSLIDSVPPLAEDATLYRGVGGSIATELLSLKSGDTFTDKGFSSTTRKEGLTKDFTSGYKERAVIVIDAPTGTKALDVAKYGLSSSGEKEVLFPTNTTYEVTKIEDDRVYVRVSNG